MIEFIKFIMILLGKIEMNKMVSKEWDLSLKRLLFTLNQPEFEAENFIIT